MMKRHIRIISLLIFGAAILSVLSIKAYRQGWIMTRTSLELNNQPALLFFTLSKGCECQMVINRRAITQVALWELPEHVSINIIRIDYDLHANLARYYKVARAPALVLLDSQGQIVWMQDVGLSDQKPLDLNEVELQIILLQR